MKMSGYQVIYRSARGERGEEIELKAIRLDSDMVDGDSGSEVERTAEGAGEDTQSLIATENNDIDENGVAKDYEVALKHIGFGLFHVLLMAINGVALLADAMEILSVSFVLTRLQESDEFAASDVENALLSSVIFMGMLIGSYTWGGLADIIGRRSVLIASLVMNGVFGAASAFSTNMTMFIICRFISGIGVGGSLPVVFPYIAELTRNKYRGPYMSIQSVFWTCGRVLCGGIAWIILPLNTGNRFHSWRLFIAVSSIPAFIGALLYILLPESPRYLLEHGKKEKALRGLKLAHKINHFHKKDSVFLIKNINVKTEYDMEKRLVVNGGRLLQRLAKTWSQIKQVWSQTRELYNITLLRRTILLNTILFSLSFGAYCFLLWIPSYLEQVTDIQKQHDFNSFCHHQHQQSSSKHISLSDYCGCDGTNFVGENFTNAEFRNVKISHCLFEDVTFSNVTFSDFYLEDCSFIDCELNNVIFGARSQFKCVDWNQSVFHCVNVSGLSVCGGEMVGWGSGEECNDHNVSDEMVTMTEGGNVSCDGVKDVKVECEALKEDTSLYRDLFIVAAAAVPGNIASAIAVFFMRRNYWMAISMFLSTASVFLLYIAHTELFIVIVLCIFTAVSTPAWNDSNLLISELYPTHLRSSAMGIHLLFARIGAIIATNIFGLLLHVNPSIPILLVACVLLVGSIAALPLPKTTRKTLLK